MTPVLDKSRPYSTIMGSSPASAFQDGNHFDGRGNYLTWAQAAGEDAVEGGASRAEKQSLAASLKVVEKAPSPVVTDAPQLDGKMVVGAPSAKEAVAEAMAAVNEEREYIGAPSIEYVEQEDVKAKEDHAADQEAKQTKIDGYQKRYDRAISMHHSRVTQMCVKIVKDCKERGVDIDDSYPRTGVGSKLKNATFIAANTE